MKPTEFIEHPEGGRFQEVFRSTASIKTSAGETRSALTHIYFSLKQGEVSKFHKVTSDEIWNFYQGKGLKLYTWDGNDTPPTCTVLSAESNNFCHIVAAGEWQAAEPIDGTVLVGCSVGPGFEFEDFELIDPDSDIAKRAISIDPSLAKLV